MSNIQLEVITEEVEVQIESQKVIETSLSHEQGPQGPRGYRGENGESAYEIAKRLSKPNTSSESEWLESLKGKDGSKGVAGPKGDSGANGQKGDNGESAYEIARRLGKPNTNSEEEWLESLKGKDGSKGVAGPKGDSGANGQKGENGVDGFTPTIDIQEGAGTHTIVITNKSNVKRAVIRDGRDGERGSNGEVGPRGPVGDTGKTPNITIRVNALDPDDDASVSKSGDAENPIFEIGIPRGRDGKDGVNGGTGTAPGNAITFEDNYCKNARTFHSKNGYIKTGASGLNRTEDLPSGRESWGVLFFIGENPSKGTGIQTYYVCTGDYSGEIWTRAFTNGSPSPSGWQLSNGDILKTISNYGTTITLTQDKYQTVTLGGSASIQLPNVKGFKEIHLFLTTTSKPTLNLPRIKWQNGKTPIIEGNKNYEFIFTTLTGSEWLGGVIVYE